MHAHPSPLIYWLFLCPFAARLAIDYLYSYHYHICLQDQKIWHACTAQSDNGPEIYGNRCSDSTGGHAHPYPTPLVRMPLPKILITFSIDAVAANGVLDTLCHHNSTPVLPAEGVQHTRPPSLPCVWGFPAGPHGTGVQHDAVGDGGV